MACGYFIRLCETRMIGRIEDKIPAKRKRDTVKVTPIRRSEEKM